MTISAAWALYRNRPGSGAGPTSCFGLELESTSPCSPNAPPRFAWQVVALWAALVASPALAQSEFRFRCEKLLAPDSAKVDWTPERVRPCLSQTGDDILEEVIQRARTLRPSNPSEIAVAILAFEELRRRGALKPSTWRRRIDMAFNDWNWRDLEQLRVSEEGRKYIGNAFLPTSADELTQSAIVPGLWHVVNTRDENLPQLKSLKNGIVVVVKFHPACSPCKRAGNEIERIPELKQIMARHGIWASFVDVNFDLRLFRAWSQSHPSMQPVLVRDWRSMGVPGEEETPIAYIMKQGQIIETIVGWPPGGTHGQDLLRILATHGFAAERETRGRLR